MKIEWGEDLGGGTNERPVWALRGAVNDVAAEVRLDVTLNTTTRRLEKLRLDVLDCIRAGLGLPEDAIGEEDTRDRPAAMGALRRMAMEVSP